MIVVSLLYVKHIHPKPTNLKNLIGNKFTQADELYLPKQIKNIATHFGEGNHPKFV